MQREQGREHARGLQLTTGRAERPRRRLRARTSLSSSSGMTDESSPRGGASLGLGSGLLDYDDDDDDEDNDNEEVFESHMDAATTRIIEQTRRVASRLRLASLPQRRSGTTTSKESDPGAGAGPVPETDQEQQQQQGRDTRRKDSGNDVMTSGYNTL